MISSKKPPKKNREIRTPPTEKNNTRADTESFGKAPNLEWKRKIKRSLPWNLDNYHHEPNKIPLKNPLVGEMKQQKREPAKWVKIRTKTLLWPRNNGTLSYNKKPKKTKTGHDVRGNHRNKNRLQFRPLNKGNIGTSLGKVEDTPMGG